MINRRNQFLSSAEAGYERLQHFSLLVQRKAGCSGLLYHRRVLLRHLIHLIDGSIDLFEADGLFRC